ncbi:SMP-30/gluconolactonase/LRE family protein [Aquabacterium sp.]|uniref:SMP-30/gluconolactonase/LRE family protein n=1 Tax=Aquabacterium sp. TaxID=1872578 RepID=UPI002C653932|nr:SMP-30/gluconolactonase/LRE family protein [Aquabacterium sp.]HSW07460.1 SMP-30/gluconolactonase/LRE family protein [Aquabacterium sp.]
MTTGPEFPFQPSQRYPDPRIEVLEEHFRSVRLFSAAVEQLASGCRWAEGPVWFGDGRFLLWSDIPNNRILRWDECSGSTSVFRQPSNNANGLTRDMAGRLLACEHLTRRITRTEYDGTLTVLADSFDGKRLNSPNDIVCQRDGSIWFTDPSFGIHGWWEGAPAAQERPHGVYRIDGATGRLDCLLDDLAAPNGLVFSPDESLLYVIESRGLPHRRIWAYDVAGATLKNKRLHVDAQGPGALDGMACDIEGRLWCGWGDGGSGAEAEALDGVRVFDRDGTAIGHIHLPERCANVTFGGAHRNRLFMAASHSLYALYVNTQGA